MHKGDWPNRPYSASLAALQCSNIVVRIMAPLYSHTLIPEVIGLPPWASVVSKVLESGAPAHPRPRETGATLRREICADEQAVSNIEGILGLAVADEAAAAGGGEQAQLASKRRSQGEMVSADAHMDTRSAGLPHLTYEEELPFLKKIISLFRPMPSLSSACG